VRARAAAALALAGIAVGIVGWGRAPSPAPATQLLGRLAPARRIDFTLDLVLPRARALDRDLAAVIDPRSPQFHHYISAAEFGARYGISTRALAGLERELVRDGVRITESYPQRTALRVSAPVSAITRLFGVAIGRFADRAGDAWHAPLGRPAIPRALAPLVSDVDGLSTEPVWRPEDVPESGLAPPDTGSAYDLGPLYDMNILGQGQTVAIVALSDYDHDDPAAYANEFALHGPAPRIIDVDGGTHYTGGADETNLDIDVVRSVAPSAQVLVYEAPDSPTGFADVLSQVIATHSATVVSTSWGQCQPDLDPAEYAADVKQLAVAVRVGISVFSAAGDNGAYDCQSDDLSDHRLSVDWPGASADAISVGGTRLYLDADGSYDHEAAWEGVLSDQGGGGGLASGIPRPSWQTGTGVVNSYSNGERQVPDVAADADPGTGWAIYSSGPANSSGSFSPGGPGEAGGTSGAAPFWAASLALVEQYVQSHGAGKVGFADPMLYALATGAQYPAFHDVTIGSNRFYPATHGWDFATGLGSPDVYNLARDAVAYLKK
jgi:kumamolisin